MVVKEFQLESDVASKLLQRFVLVRWIKSGRGSEQSKQADNDVTGDAAEEFIKYDSI